MVRYGGFTYSAGVAFAGFLVGASILAGCSRSKELDTKKTASLFTEVIVETAHGLSGLAADDQGRLWTVAERDAKAYRVTLDAALVPALETFAVTGVPGDTDLEGIEELGGDRMAFGTEGRVDGVATVLLGRISGNSIMIDQTIQLTAEQIGIAMKKNHGAEGICGRGDTLLVAIEGAGEDAGKRWAPVLRIENGQLVRRHRVWLTSKSGKLSGLDCTVAPDGTITAWAIERHFEVTKILALTVPVGEADITPRVALDIGDVIDSKRNLEGIAQLPDGRVVTESDNQWRTIEGASVIQVFAPGVVR
ncbi:MAG: esterase-like activity of phytase family protein [Kofleriaceae bacterium]